MNYMCACWDRPCLSMYASPSIFSLVKELHKGNLLVNFNWCIIYLILTNINGVLGIGVYLHLSA
jgi:hypothetical protein